MKSIIHIIPTLRIGGCEKQLLETSLSFSDSHNIIPLIKAGKLYPRFSKIPPTKTDSFLAAYYQSAAKPLILLILAYRSAKILRAFPKSSIVITYSEEMILIIGWLLKINIIKQKCIFRFDSPLATSLENGSKLLRIINKIIYKKLCIKLLNEFSGYISVSKLMIDDIKKWLGKTDIPIFYIPNTLEPTRKNHKYVAKSRIHFLYIGRLTKIKGVDILIKAFSLIQKTHRYAFLSIIGEGPEEKKLKKLSKKLAIQKNVMFLGFIDNFHDYAKQCTACIIPSRSEAFGKIILEMMSLHVLVIASDCLYGPREIVTHNKNGICFNNGSERSLAKSMHYAINIPLEKRNKILKNASKFTKQFSLTYFTKKMSELEHYEF